MEDGESMLQAIEKTWSFERHWKSKVTSVQFANFKGKVHAVARKCGERASDSEALKLSNTLFAEADKLEKRNALFEVLRNNFAMFAKTELTAVDKEILTKAGEECEEVLLQIFLSRLEALVEGLGKDPLSLEGFFNVLRCPETLEKDIPSLTTLLPNLPNGTMHRQQDAFMLALADKVFALAEGKEKCAIYKMVPELVQLMDPHQDYASLAQVDTKNKALILQPCGWFGQSWVDLTFLALVCEVCAEVESTQHAKVIDPARIVGIFKSRTLVSVRVMSHFRGTSTAGATARRAWEKSEKKLNH